MPKSNQVKSSYAGFWRRLAAGLVDNWIVSIIGIGISLSLGTDPFNQEASTFLESIDQVITFIMTLAFTVLFWVNYDGTTPGKKAMGIKVISTKGNKISYPQALIRYFGQLLSAVVLLLGFLWVIWDDKKQTWHDKMAQTVVIKTDNKGYFWRSFAVIAVSLIGYTLLFTYFHQELSQ